MLCVTSSQSMEDTPTFKYALQSNIHHHPSLYTYVSLLGLLSERGLGPLYPRGPSADWCFTHTIELLRRLLVSSWILWSSLKIWFIISHVPTFGKTHEVWARIWTTLHPPDSAWGTIGFSMNTSYYISTSIQLPLYNLNSWRMRHTSASASYGKHIALSNGKPKSLKA